MGTYGHFRNLCDTGVLSKSDPRVFFHSDLILILVVVVFEKSFPDNQWVELDRTEIIHNHLNPDFAKKIVMEYHFEEQQRLNFVVLVTGSLFY